ncbi:hypothetical protein AB0D32_20070 [Micromonospora sp. NPDC048170]|uniref:hypothetical protein n=1 Tax=Micromonospora sp. NPDC048170 TaxID=3154819 RepID=UPI0033ED4563
MQREHIDYLAERGAHWILTVKGNQPHLHAQLTALPWRAVPDAARDAAIDALRLTGVTNIAAANRHHARDNTRPLALLSIT